MRAQDRLALSRRQDEYGLHFDSLVLHCPSPLRSPRSSIRLEWGDVCRSLLTDNYLADVYREPPDLTVVTINTRNEPGLLQRCFRHLGLRHLVVLGHGVELWAWAYKISLVHDWLSNGGCQTAYLAYLDGDDVLLIGDPAEMLSRFVASGTDLLFCNTRFDWPPSFGCRAFERVVYPPEDRLHCHLNSGGWIGRTAYITALVAELASAIRNGHDQTFRASGQFDDQLAWRELHRREYPRLQVDTKCRVFLRFDGVR